MTAFTVAVIGADGSGKTTVCRRLERSLPVQAKYIYMGVNAEASNVMLPTTRALNALRRASGGRPAGGPPDHRSGRPSGGIVRRVLRSARALAGVSHRMAEEWYRQILAWYHLGRGRIVVFDRHFYTDYYAHDVIAGRRDRPVDRRLHGFMLERLYPKPDLVILLDAPTEVLWARKPEGTFEALARRREEYLRLRDALDFEIVDATQPEDAVFRRVSELILDRRRNATRG